LDSFFPEKNNEMSKFHENPSSAEFSCANLMKLEIFGQFFFGKILKCQNFIKIRLLQNFLVRILLNLSFLDSFFFREKILKCQNFMKIRLVGAEMFLVDIRTDRRDEGNSRFRNFTNAPQKCTLQYTLFCFFFLNLHDSLKLSIWSTFVRLCISCIALFGLFDSGLTIVESSLSVYKYVYVCVYICIICVYVCMCIYIRI